MSARWNSADLALKKPVTPTNHSKHPDVADTPNERGTGQQKEPAFPAASASPATYLVGPYALSIGGRLHAEQLPDRLRIVITGPASEELPAALVAALTHFTAKP